MMKNKGKTIPVINFFSNNKIFKTPLWHTAAFVLLSWVLSFSSSFAQAQCTIPIGNNTIQATAPLCSGTRAFLKGSIPTGGTGSYQYLWQVSDNNCGVNSFSDIPNSNSPNYSVPTTTDAKCFRRIVISGSCSSISDNANISAVSPTPSGPTVSVNQQTCTNNSSSIVVSSPLGEGLSYSMDGTNYTNSTGTFTCLLPGTYNVTVKAGDGCISPATRVVLTGVEETPLAPSVTVTTQPTCEVPTGTVSISGLPASGTWTINSNPVGVTKSGTGTTTSISNIPPGTYTFTVTDDQNFTSDPSNSVIINPPPTLAAPSASVTTAPTCAAPTATITVSSPAPAAGITYSIDGTTYTNTSGVFTGLAPSTTYQVTYRQANGCTSAQTAVIVGAPTGTLSAPTASVTTAPTCAAPTATITVSSPAPAAGITYSINGTTYTNTSGVFTGLAPSTTYQVTYRQANGCTSAQAAVIVGAPTGTLAAPTASVTTAPTCAAPTATITVSSPAPAAGITYSINGTTYTNTSGVFTGLAPSTTYQVTYRQANGCTSAPTAVMVGAVPPSTLAATATTIGNLCGLNTGIITVNATGGVPAYTYSLNGATPVTTNIFSGLAAGTYNVAVRDALGCTVTITPIVSSLNSTLTATANITNAPCGTTTGSAIISASGGNPPYTYSLDGGSFGTASGFSNLSIGSHTVTVKDAPGCTFDVGVTIAATPTPVAPTATPTQPTCVAATGTITFNSPTPSSGITYSINGVDYTNTTGIFSGLTPGNYIVSYKNSAGCTSATSSVTINAQPPTPVQAVASVSAQPSCSVTTGTITITQPAPAAGLSYSIDGINYVNTTGVFTGVAPGSYNVTVKNSFGCVSPPLALTVNAVPAVPTAPTVTVTSQPTCSVPTGNVSVTSTTTGFEFSVDNGAFVIYPAIGFNLTPGVHNIRVRRTSDNCVSLATSFTIQNIPNAPAAPTISVSQQPTCTVSTGTVIITSSTAGLEFSVDGGIYGIYPSGGYQLSPGNHTVTARSTTDNSCVSNSAAATINNVPAPPNAPTVSIAHPTCLSPTGTASITSSTAGLQFSVDGGTFAVYPTGGYQLNSGSHSITARRTSDNCTSTLVTFVVNPQPAPPAAPVAVVSEQPNCTISTGTIVVSSPAPSTGISYSINGTNYTNTTGVFPGLVPGTYNVTVRNAQGCTSPPSILTVNSAPAVPPQPTATVSQQPNCTIATGTITVTQPAPGIGVTYSIDGVNYTNTTGIFTGLLPGSYNITAKNAQGCVSAPRNLTVNPPTASTLRATATATDILCGLTGTITVTTTGGVSPYTYSLNDATPVVTNIFTGLQAGSYKVRVTDAAGCFVEVNATVDLINSTLTATANITNIACGQTTGSAVISATGGTPPYTYSLDGGAFGVVSGFTNLTAGQHIVKVKDAPGCTFDVSVNILPAPVPVAPTATITQPTCAVSTGTITVTLPTPASGITYSIDGINYANTTGIFSNLAPGNYNLSYKSSQGCASASLAVIINAQPPNPAQPVASVSEQPNCTVATGTITVTQPAPSTGITYSVNGTSYTNTTGVFTGLAPGTYNVTVKNALGCISQATPVVVNAAPPSNLFATATIENNLCSSNAGTITIVATGGTSPYTYSLNGATAVTNNIFTGLAAGNYKVTVSDASGCSFDVNATIQQPAASPTLVVTNPTAVCAGSTTSLKTAAITAGSGTGLTYTYWKDAAATLPLPDAEATAAVAGTYYIKATNQSGCFTIKPVVVTVSANASGTITPTNPTEVCNGETLTLTASTGLSYQWYKNDILIPGATASAYAVTEAGTYNVSINNGSCTGKTPNPVVVKYKDCPNDVEVFVPTAFTPNNNRANDNLQPYFLNVRELKYFKVFNRWGQLVFETNTIGSGWDGTIKGVKQPTETYSWILECTDIRGKNIKKSGKSLLIR